MNLEQRQQIEERVAELNQKLKDSGIPQLRFDFEPIYGLVRLGYNGTHSYDLIAYIISGFYSEIEDWLNIQESRLYLYRELALYFKNSLYRLNMINNYVLELTLKGLTYSFNYDRGDLVIRASKNYKKGLTRQGTELGELHLEQVVVPSKRYPVQTQVSLIRVCHETELAANLDYIQGTFKRFDETVINLKKITINEAKHGESTK